MVKRQVVTVEDLAKAEDAAVLEPEGFDPRIPSALHPAWELAKSHPGRFVRTNLNPSQATYLRKGHSGHVVVVRNGVLWVMFPSPGDESVGDDL